MNQLCLQCLLRGDHEYCLRGSSCETAEEVVLLGFLSQDAGLHEGVCTETDLILGHREHQESAIASVEAKETSFTECLLHSVDHPLLVESGIQLHHCLCVLSWICT